MAVPPKKQRYRLCTGMNYPPHGRPGAERRAEVDDVVDDLPADAVPGLLEQGHIEPYEEGGDG